jgi:hypothetical protein
LTAGLKWKTGNTPLQDWRRDDVEALEQQSPTAVPSQKEVFPLVS